MIKNYFKIAVRSFFNHKLYSLINLIGMTIGMTCFLLLALYIQYESSYDQQHKTANRIYRVSQIQKGNVFRGTDRFAVTPLPLNPAMKEAIPEVETATTFQLSETLIAHEADVFYENGIFADENFFDVFTYPLIKGVGKEALTNPNNIILTESMAKKYFGSESPLDKTILLRNEKPLIVKGVIEDVPQNQHFTFNFITSVNNFPFYQNDLGNWASNNYRTYLILPEGNNPEHIENKMKVFDEQLSAAYGALGFDFEKPQYFLQPLKDIHLRSQINMELGTNNDMRYLYLAGSIALIILLLALINYINLATARSSQRTMEVGMRKVLGANKRQLVYQFMIESFLLSLFSFGFALVFVNLLLPFFNQFLDLEILFNLDNNTNHLIGYGFFCDLFMYPFRILPCHSFNCRRPYPCFKRQLDEKQKGQKSFKKHHGGWAICCSDHFDDRKRRRFPTTQLHPK